MDATVQPRAAFATLTGVPVNVRKTGKFIFFGLNGGPYLIRLPMEGDVFDMLKKAEGRLYVRFEWNPLFFTEGGEFIQSEAKIEIKNKIRGLKFFDLAGRPVDLSKEARVLNLGQGGR